MFLRLAAFVLASILGCSGDDSMPDADASTPDARDAADDRDASDASDGRDTQDTNGDSHDGGPTDPVWRPLPGFPSECDVEWAEFPERLLNVEWQSCGAGCERLVDDLRMTRSFNGGGWHDEGRNYFSVVQGARGANERMVVLAATDGEVLAAWRDEPFDGSTLCSVDTPAGSDGQVGFIVTVFTPESTEQRVYFTTVADAGSIAEPVAVVTPLEGLPRGNTFQRAAVSGTTFAGLAQPIGEVWLFEEGAFRRLGYGGSNVPGSPQGMSLVGDHVLWEEWGTTSRAAHGTFDDLDGGSVFLEVADVWIRGFQTDGRDMVWSQCNVSSCDEREPWTHEFWTAPYVRDPAELDPRRLFETGGPSAFGKLGAGYYVYRNVGDLEAVRLSDGTTFRYLFSEVGPLPTIVYVAPGEVGVSSRIGGDGTLVRLQLSAFTEIDAPFAPD